MRDFLKAYKELVQSKLLDTSVVDRHVAQHVLIDKILPKTLSFFLIVEINSHSYPFVGSNQELISGFANDFVQEKGFEFFIQRLHPDEREIFLLKAAPEMAECVVNAPEEDKKNLQFQYNYKFQRKDGDYINLMEQCYILEVDDEGKGALVLCNVTLLETKDHLPLRWSARLLRNNTISETLFVRTYEESENRLDVLTPRELDILRNLAAGKTSREIGQELFISPLTVDTHRRRLLGKLECRSVVELARLAFVNGML